MKNILAVVAIAFVFIGCTAKLQTDVEPYVTMHENGKQTVKVHFIGVNDQRTTKIATTIYNKGEAYKQYPLSANVKTWYEEAFMRELKNADMLGLKKASNITVLVNIKSIEAKYKRYSIDKKNMTANVKLELVIEKDGMIVTSNININQSTYKPMILDAGGFESIINESMKDSVSRTVSILIKKIKG